MFGFDLASRLLRNASHSTPRIPLVALIVAVASYLPGCGLLGGEEDSNDECEQGSEGCECFGNDTCLKGLTCLSELCVDVDGKPEGDAGAAEEDDEGEPEKDEEDATEADAETDEPNSSDEDPSEEAPEDETSSEENPEEETSESSAEETEAGATDEVTDEPAPMTSEEPATESPMTEEPMTDEPVTEEPMTEEPMTEPPEPACTEGSGSCADGSGIDCVGGELTTRDCSGCALLSCGVACCGSFWALAAETYPYVQRDDLITSFVATESEISLAATFGAIREFAAIGFTFDTAVAVSPASVHVSASIVGTVALEVSLELDDNTGCLYTTSLGDIVAENVCWGDWELTGYGGAANKLLVRIQSEEVAQSATISISGITFSTL